MPANTASWTHWISEAWFSLAFRVKALIFCSKRCSRHYHVPFQAFYVLLGSELRPQLGGNEAGLRFRHLRLAQGFVEGDIVLIHRFHLMSPAPLLYLYATQVKSFPVREGR